MHKKKGAKIASQIVQNPYHDPKVSFNSLTKSKKKAIYHSQISELKSPKSGMIHSQLRKRTDTINKQNIRDQYQLFTNIIRSRKQSQNSNILRENYQQTRLTTQRKNTFLRMNTEYGGQGSQLRMQSRKRSQSKHSVQKYFEGTASLIKKKSSQISQNRQISSQMESLAPGQISLDPVNRSQDSIQFDMSPFLK